MTDLNINRTNEELKAALENMGFKRLGTGSYIYNAFNGDPIHITDSAIFGENNGWAVQENLNGSAIMVNTYREAKRAAMAIAEKRDDAMKAAREGATN